MRPWLLAGGGLLALMIGIVALGMLLQRRVLFPAPRVFADGGPPERVERLWLETGSGRTEAWLLSPSGAGGKRSPLLVFAHGNGELIDHWSREFETALGWGVHVLLVEYPGYGRSTGRPSERSIARVMLEAYDQLVRRPSIDPDRVIGYGRSLGGGAVCALARERRLAALVLESSFTSVRALAAGIGWPGALVLDPFDNEAVLRTFPAPVLVLHGRRDEVIPPGNAPLLARASARSELVWLECGHNDCARPWREIRSFLEAHGLLERATSG